MERFKLTRRPGVPGAHPGVHGDQHQGAGRGRAVRGDRRAARRVTAGAVVQRWAGRDGRVPDGPPRRRQSGGPRPSGRDPAAGPPRPRLRGRPRSPTVAGVDPFRGLGMPRIPGLTELLAPAADPDRGAGPAAAHAQRPERDGPGAHRRPRRWRARRSSRRSASPSGWRTSSRSWRSRSARCGRASSGSAGCSTTPPSTPCPTPCAASTTTSCRSSTGCGRPRPGWAR